MMNTAMGVVAAGPTRGSRRRNPAQENKMVQLMEPGWRPVILTLRIKLARFNVG